MIHHVPQVARAARVRVGGPQGRAGPDGRPGPRPVAGGPHGARGAASGVAVSRGEPLRLDSHADNGVEAGLFRRAGCRGTSRPASTRPAANRRRGNGSGATRGWTRDRGGLREESPRVSRTWRRSWSSCRAPGSALRGLVVDAVDRIMHGMKLGSAGMHSQVRQWTRGGMLASLLDTLFEQRIRRLPDLGPWERRDHRVRRAPGGLGRGPARTARARLLRPGSAGTRREAVSRRRWNGPRSGLPEDYLALLAPARRSFVRESERPVAHGGVTLEEIVVPFVAIERSGPNTRWSPPPTRKRADSPSVEDQDGGDARRNARHHRVRPEDQPGLAGRHGRVDRAGARRTCDPGAARTTPRRAGRRRGFRTAHAGRR